jgi:hypothetical protein
VAGAARFIIREERSRRIRTRNAATALPGPIDRGWKQHMTMEPLTLLIQRQAGLKK